MSKKILGWVTLMVVLMGCGTPATPIVIPHRESLIPDNGTKMMPENDDHPPLCLSEEFTEPIPLPYPINTRGFEDSAFIMPDGQTLYFWYTPDGNKDVVSQSMENRMVDTDSKATDQSEHSQQKQNAAVHLGRPLVE